MKKFFEKYDLFKIIGLVILFVVALSWIIPTGSISGSDLVVGEITRIGISDIGQYLLLGIYYFAVIVTFLLILGGFYSILSKTSGYQRIIESVAKKIKGKEYIFVLIVSFVFAGLTSISNEIYQLLIFVPFIITIMSKLKFDKITAFCTTFGSILIGVIGATYSPVIFEYINYYFSLTYSSEILTKVALFAIAYVIFNFFTIRHLKKVLNSNSKDVIEDKFAIPETKTKSKKTNKEKAKILPVIIVLALLFVLQVMGYIGWDTSFGVKVFDNFHNWVMGLSIGDFKIVSAILGTINAFGSWDLYTIQIMMIIASIILAIAYKINFNDYYESFINGAKKMCRTTILVLLAFTVCVFVTVYPFLPVIVDWIMGLTKSFNIYLASISTAIASFFTVEMRYTVSSIGTLFAGQFASEANNPVIMLILQSFYGLVQFVAPTSMMVVIGLSYLNISYKKYLSYIWRFLVGMLVCVLVIISLVAFL